MSEHVDEPLTAELAPLPREQVGPFLLLGIDKAAGSAEIAAQCAERLAGVRPQDDAASLRDLEWARAVVLDAEQRLRADVVSLNADTADRLVGKLAERLGVGSSSGPRWQPLDVVKPPEDAEPVVVPDPAGIRAAIVLPEMPTEAPAAASVLAQWIRGPLDPWACNLACPGPSETPLTAPHAATSVEDPGDRPV